MEYVREGQISSKNWWATLLLGVFLGYLGIHRFYVGKVGTGLLYFFTAGLFGIGWVVDLIMVCCLAFRDSSNKLIMPRG